MFRQRDIILKEEEKPPSKHENNNRSSRNDQIRMLFSNISNISSPQTRPEALNYILTMSS